MWNGMETDNCVECNGDRQLCGMEWRQTIVWNVMEIDNCVECNGDRQLCGMEQRQTIVSQHSI